MGDEPRKRSGLTPLSGELRVEADWTPPGPVAEQYKPKVRAEKRAPTTTRGMLLHGLKRLGLFVGAVGAGIAIVGALIVYFADADAATTFPVLFLVAGALVMGGGLWSVFGHEWAPETGYEQIEKESWVSDVFAYFVLGAAIIGVGLLLDAVI
jgi:hypothetical protein